MTAGWTRLGDGGATSAPRAASDPWAGGSWRFTDPATARVLRREPSASSDTATNTDDPDASQLMVHPGGERSNGRRGRSFAGLAMVALLSGALGGAAVEGLDDDGSGTATVLGGNLSSSHGRAPESVAGVADTVLPSVVSVDGNGANGSGVVIAEDGYILTNNHVVAAARDEPLGLTLFDGRQFEADVVGTSPSYDVAVLQIDADDLQPIVFGDSSSVAVGDPVVAIGSPLGLDATVTSGIVSALDRPVAAGDPAAESQAYINALQTDAAINPGNSGGPLVDGRGRVIGVNSAIATMGVGGEAGNIGLGFAIPIEQVQRTARQLIDDGEAVYPVLGVLLDNEFGGQGARVTGDTDDGMGVEPGGPADASGIRPGDVIVSLDGDEVRNAPEFIVRLRSNQPGDEVTLEVRRDDDVLEFTVTLDEAVG